MENKSVGYILLGVSLLVILVIVMFNSSLKEIIIDTCGLPHAETCSMTKNLNQQTYIALGVTFILIIVSLVMIFSKPDERIIMKTRILKNNQKKKQIDLSQLKGEEKRVLHLVQSNKAIFQADLIEKSGFGKAKITRILDRLEGNGLVERKRRGMTNVVVVKEQDI